MSQETTSIGNHQGNGGAERTVEIVRSHASILLSHLESCCEAGKQLFSCAHPIFHWALAHSAWIHNRYKVSMGQTPYERATGRSYSGKIAQFGERVMGFIKQERKSDPKWLPAIWLGRAVNNDAHILAHEGIVFVSRSIRRVPDAFDLKMLGAIETMPCDHGLTALGHRLFQTTKRYVGGGPLPAVGTPDEAGSDPPSDRDDSNAVGVEQQSQAGQSAGGAPSEPPAATAVDAGMSVDANGRQDEARDIVPQSPVVRDDEVPLGASTRPSKAARIEPRSVRAMAVQDQHEDEVLTFSFEDDDLDMMQLYDEEISDEPYDEADTEDSDLQKVIFEFSPNEPNLTPEELQQLDAVADRVEVRRLQNMSVTLKTSMLMMLIK